MNVMRFLLKIPVYLLFFKSGRRLLASVVMIVVLAILFFHLGPEPFDMSPMQKRIGNDLVDKAVEQFPWNREVGSVLLVADEEAWSPFFQDAIRAKVTNYKTDGSRKFDILPDSFTARVVKTLGFKNNPGKLSDKSIRRIVDSMEADTLLLVRFTSRDYIEDTDSASGHLSCTFFGKGKSNPLTINVSTEQKKEMGLFGFLAYYFKTMSTSHKLVWGILGVLLFPFLMAPITLTVVQAQSAKANAFMIFVYAVVIFTFEGLMFSAPKGILQALLMCAWGIAIVWYILKTCDLIAAPGFKRRMQIQGKH